MNKQTGKKFGKWIIFVIMVNVQRVAVSPRNILYLSYVLWRIGVKVAVKAMQKGKI